MNKNSSRALLLSIAVAPFIANFSSGEELANSTPATTMPSSREQKNVKNGNPFVPNSKDYPICDWIKQKGKIDEGAPSVLHPIKKAKTELHKCCKHVAKGEEVVVSWWLTCEGKSIGPWIETEKYRTKAIEECYFEKISKIDFGTFVGSPRGPVTFPFRC